MSLQFDHHLELGESRNNNPSNGESFNPSPFATKSLTPPPFSPNDDAKNELGALGGHLGWDSALHSTALSRTQVKSTFLKVMQLLYRIREATAVGLTRAPEKTPQMWHQQLHSLEVEGDPPAMCRQVRQLLAPLVGMHPECPPNAADMELNWTGRTPAWHHLTRRTGKLLRYRRRRRQRRWLQIKERQLKEHAAKQTFIEACHVDAEGQRSENEMTRAKTLKQQERCKSGRMVALLLLAERLLHLRALRVAQAEGSAGTPPSPSMLCDKKKISLKSEVESPEGLRQRGACSGEFSSGNPSHCQGGGEQDPCLKEPEDWRLELARLWETLKAPASKESLVDVDFERESLASGTSSDHHLLRLVQIRWEWDAFISPNSMESSTVPKTWVQASLPSSQFWASCLHSMK